MARRANKTAQSPRKSKLVRAVTDHPVAAVGIAGAVVAGTLLVRKAVKTAANVATIKAAGKAAEGVTRAVRAKK